MTTSGISGGIEKANLNSLFFNSVLFLFPLAHHPLGLFRPDETIVFLNGNLAADSQLLCEFNEDARTDGAS